LSTLTDIVQILVRGNRDFKVTHARDFIVRFSRFFGIIQ
jgi:hypothetical protein